MRTSRWLLAAVMITAFSCPALAASATGWDGTWSGAWGGKPSEATSITIAGKQVVSYQYKGESHPVATSNVSYSISPSARITRRRSASRSTASPSRTCVFR